MTATFSTKPMSTSMWCSTISTVQPSRCISRMLSTSPATSPDATPAIGSSSSTILASVANRTAISSLRLSPWEMSPAAVSSLWVSPTFTS
jgi:hypothetical protein